MLRRRALVGKAVGVVLMPGNIAADRKPVIHRTVPRSSFPAMTRLVVNIQVFRGLHTICVEYGPGPEQQIHRGRCHNSFWGRSEKDVDRG